MEDQVEESAGVFTEAFNNFNTPLIPNIDEILPPIPDEEPYQHVLVVDGEDQEKLREILKAEFPTGEVTVAGPRVIVIGSGGKTDSDIITGMLVKLFEDRMRPYERAAQSIRDISNMFASHFFQPDFRWSALHHHLSSVGTKTKLERQQQRRKALHKFHEAQRLKKIKKAREHAQQKQKSMKRYA